MKIYTQTVCPKCSLVKFTLENAGVIDKVEFVNLDEHPEVREWLKTNEETKNLQSLPILEHTNGFTNNQQEIINIVVQA